MQHRNTILSNLNHSNINFDKKFLILFKSHSYYCRKLKSRERNSARWPITELGEQASLSFNQSENAIYHEAEPQRVILTLVSSSNWNNMPFINVETNLPASKFPEDLLKRLCSTLAAALGKPEDVSIVASVM